MAARRVVSTLTTLRCATHFSSDESAVIGWDWDLVVRLLVFVYVQGVPFLQSFDTWKFIRRLEPVIICLGFYVNKMGQCALDNALQTQTLQWSLVRMKICFFPSKPTPKWCCVPTAVRLIQCSSFLLHTLFHGQQKPQQQPALLQTLFPEKIILALLLHRSSQKLFVISLAYSQKAFFQLLLQCCCYSTTNKTREKRSKDASSDCVP
uniref:Uncharacterized protein n=1 Tax=Oryza sativa subsp. japonica TaxID=39947 RepID=Q7XC49_ORYSJ|nr:hypothetical protein LOC_Os10g41280 [Oryza sativa Japonica Group]